jgi:ribosomal protein S18 acetylase RimI-like enzyme
MFSNLENKHVEQIYDLQINNADEFGNNIWSRLEINDLIKKTGFYSTVFIEQKRIEGFGIFFEVDNFLDLYSLFVSPMYRKRGIATTIIDYAVNHCKKKNLIKIVLEVNEKNTKAINFYISKSFTKKGRRKNYYQLGENYFDAILMEMKI